MGTAHADEAAWNDAEARIRAEIRRLDDVVDDLRAGTAHLHWQGPGAGRFRWRTDRRVRELHDQRTVGTELVALGGERGGRGVHAEGDLGGVAGEHGHEREHDHRCGGGTGDQYRQPPHQVDDHDAPPLARAARPALADAFLPVRVTWPGR